MVDFSIKRYNSYSKSELIEKLREHASSSGRAFVSGRGFEMATGISESTIVNHFGTWAEFCKEAGLSPRYRRTLTREELFENLGQVWTKLGRQPRAKEMKQSLSPISISRYHKEFQLTWYEVCLQFLSWKSGVPVEEIQQEAAVGPVGARSRQRTPISLSTRYAVLVRDQFRCVKCGNSPATMSGVQLHVDHMVPHSKGGPDTPDNLQSLCSECNLGKSNRYTG